MTVTQTGSNIVISGNLETLNSFASTNPSQGTAKWVGLDLGTNLDSITSLKWNGYQLTEDDVAEAASVGLGAGHIVFWAKADAISEEPRTITLSADGYEDAVITVSFQEA